MQSLKILLIILFAGFIKSECKSQHKLSELSKILQSEKTVVFHYKFEADSLGDFDFNQVKSRSRHHYLWHKQGIKIQSDGSGKLFSVDSGNTLNRVDSTQFEGYNFGSFNFVYHDTIFSLGGYGFWQFNGMLRYYNEKLKGWAVIPTNKLIPLRLWFNGQVLLDPDQGKLYVIYRKPREGLLNSDQQEDPAIYLECLDLQSKIWNEKSFKVNEDVMDSWDWAYKPMFNSAYGLITFNKDNLDVYDFRNGKVGRIKAIPARSLLDSWYMNNTLLMFSKGNRFYHMNPQRGNLDSFILNPDDIEWKQTRILKSEFTFWKYLMGDKSLFLAGIIIAFAGGYYLKWKDMIWRSQKNDETEIMNHSDMEIKNNETRKFFRDTLTETEKALLDLLIRNSSARKMTSVTQVNEVLGIAKKDVKFQNNVRSGAFQMINRKFNVFSGVADELIIKERTAFDKRFYEYQIHSKYLQKIRT
jgi:hypothetical protein